MSAWLSELQRQYDVKAFRYERTTRGVWLETNRGTMMLQWLPKAYVHKAAFVYEANQALQRSYLMFPIVKNKTGSIVTEIGQESFILMGWPATASNWVDYGSLGSSLAQFHCASAKLLNHIKPSFSECGLWPQVWEEKRAKMKTFEAIAIERAGGSEEDPFDAFFLDNAEYLRQIMSQSLMRLEALDYEQICENARQYGRLSYVNFGFEKFVPTREGRVFFTDPFALVEDTRSRDIAQFIKADVRSHGWRPTHVKTFLSAYHSVSPITPEELRLIYALILLPGRLLKKMETVYYRSSMSEYPSLSLFKAETDGLTPAAAYMEMKRTERLIEEFPRFIQLCFGTRVVL